MKRILTLILSLVFVFSVSCKSDDSDDGTPPYIPGQDQKVATTKLADFISQDCQKNMEIKSTDPYHNEIIFPADNCFVAPKGWTTETRTPNEQYCSFYPQGTYTIMHSWDYDVNGYDHDQKYKDEQDRFLNTLIKNSDDVIIIVKCDSKATKEIRFLGPEYKKESFSTIRELFSKSITQKALLNQRVSLNQEQNSSMVFLCVDKDISRTVSEGWRDGWNITKTEYKTKNPDTIYWCPTNKCKEGYSLFGVSGWDGEDILPGTSIDTVLDRKVDNYFVIRNCETTGYNEGNYLLTYKKIK